MNKTEKNYWEKLWKDSAMPKAVDPRVHGLNNYVNRRFHEFFTKTLNSLSGTNVKLLEIGCAKSAWLPYFAKEFGVDVMGIDYSQVGCEMARIVLKNSGVNGSVVHDDFFKPPLWMKDHFDIVVSFGVAGHFASTSDCIKAFSYFLKEGGLLITNIPNMIGLNAVIQKCLDISVYDIHVPLSCEQLENAHVEAGMDVVECRYFMFLNMSVINIENKKNRIWYSPVVRLRAWLSKMVWFFEGAIAQIKPNRISSPYINCVARKQCE